ncbi:hypothetical protein KIL84_007804, partial [Mauremys mutica]
SATVAGLGVDLKHLLNKPGEHLPFPTRTKPLPQEQSLLAGVCNFHLSRTALYLLYLLLDTQLKAGLKRRQKTEADQENWKCKCILPKKERRLQFIFFDQEETEVTEPEIRGTTHSTMASSLTKNPILVVLSANDRSSLLQQHGEREAEKKGLSHTSLHPEE